MTLPSKKLLRTLGGEILPTPPVWLMRQAGRYLPEYRELRSHAKNFLDFCLTPDLAVEATLQPLRRYNLDAAIVFADILIVPHLLGQAVTFVEGEGPRLAPVRSVAALNALERDFGRAQPIYETLRRLREELLPTCTLIGFAGSPWTVACYMVQGGGNKDFPAVHDWCTKDPEGFQVLIDTLTSTTMAYLTAQVEAGAEVIQLFDSWAGQLPDLPDFTRWVIHPTATIVRALRSKYPSLPIIGFPRGAGAHYAAYAAQTGVTAVSLDQGVSLPWATKTLPPNLVLQGNLDPAHLVTGGAGLTTAVREITSALKGRPHIFNLGHGITPDARPENVTALLNCLREA